MIHDSISALRLIIYQPHAHYRVPFTYRRRHTYPLPSYSAVRGLLANILGIRGYTFGKDPEENEDFQKLKGLRIGISGRFAAKSTEYTWFRNLSKEEHFKRFGAGERRSVWVTAEHPGGQSPVLIDVLNDVRIVVYLGHEDESFLQYLAERIQNPSNRLYPLYLGRAEDWIVFEEVSIVELSVAERDADFEHFFFVPERPWMPLHNSFDFQKVDGLLYRVPFFWELRDGSRNFHYVLTKLNDGRIKGISFLFDASFGQKGLPVFLAFQEVDTGGQDMGEIKRNLS